MRVGVVTPYYKESPETLRRCHESVANQTYGDVTHFMISDGFPLDEIDQWENVVHIRLPNHGDYGDTPRCIGALSAAASGCDAIALLDADNSFELKHIETLLAVQKATGVQVVTATRNLYREDLSFMAVDKESDGVHFNDTNCYLVMRPAFHAFSAWGFKEQKECIVGDRVFWETIKKMNVSRAHCTLPTVNYVTTFAFHYQQCNEEPPANSKIIVRFNGEKYSTLMNFNDYLEKVKAINAASK